MLNLCLKLRKNKNSCQKREIFQKTRIKNVKFFEKLVSKT